MLIKKQILKNLVNNYLKIEYDSIRVSSRIFNFLIIVIFSNMVLNINCSGKNLWQDAIDNFDDLYELGKFIESKKAAEYALDLAKETKSNINFRLAESHINLGMADIALLNLKSAKTSLNMALEILDKSKKRNHSLHASYNIHIGHIYSLEGDIPNSMEYLNIARQYFLDNNELQSENYVKLIEIIAQNHFAVGDFKGSEKLYRESLNLREKFILDKQNSLAQCSNNLAALLRIKGELKESEFYIKYALEIWDRIFSGNHEKIGIGLNNLGVIYKDQGRYEEAEATLSKALLINEKCLGEDHFDLAPDYNNMAQLMHSKGNYKAAEEYYQKAINILVQNEEGYRFEIGQIFANKGELHFTTGDYTIALECFSNAIDQISFSSMEQKLAILKSLAKRQEQIEELINYDLNME